jgi:hypothetical protein
MKSLMKLAGVGICALSIIGCATKNSPPPLAEQKPYQSNPEYSFAKNVAIASGLSYNRVRDAKVPTGTLSKTPSPRGVAEEGGTSAPFMIATAGLEVLSPTSLMGSGPAIFLDILSNLATPDAPEATSVYFGWVKKNSPKDGSTSVGTVKAITQVVSDYMSKNGYASAIYDKKWMNIGKFEGIKILDDENCKDAKEKGLLVCFIGSSYANNGVQYQGPRVFSGEGPAYYPDFIGEGEALFVRGGVIDSITKRGTKIDGGRQFDSLKMWTEVSKALPDTMSYSNGEGGLLLGKSPLILNKGNVHFFAVEADVDDKIAGN